ANTDVDLLHKGYITVTPLTMDLTDYPTLERLRETCAD
ncbi:MAG: 5'/3'-nucleotidase SurE, partial [Proteobacteria bacterium]|nr:5'/3'-nucleotidase SurE [Pseudomonadota bacterium]